MRVLNITIIGLGLIGGSLGKALVKLGYQVTAVDDDPATLQLGLDTGAACTATEDIRLGLAEAQVVILAVPIGSMSTVLKAVAPNLRPGMIVTDVGSVKSDVMAQIEDLLPDGVDFVGGHPMAGTEQVGVGGADPLMFTNAYYVLTQGPNCSQQGLETVVQLVQQIGAVPVIMDSVTHDRAVAALSHLPHLVAVALAQTAGSMEEEHPGSLDLAAGSFRDGTRVAESSPRMWRDICLANREQILASLEAFRERLDQLEQAVSSGDGEQIAAAFNQGRLVKELYRSRVKRKLAEVHEVVVSVPDQPGVLGTVASSLAQANINIANIEILRGREGFAGSLALGFRGDTVERALATIRALGLPAFVR